MLALSYTFKLWYLRFKGCFLKFLLKTKNKMRKPFCIGEYCYIMLPPLFKTRLSFLCFSLKHKAFIIFLVLKLRYCLIYIFISLMSLVSCSSFNIFLYTSKFLLNPHFTLCCNNLLRCLPASILFLTVSSFSTPNQIDTFKI